MRDVLYRVFALVLASGQHAHIFLVKLDVDFGQMIHWFLYKKLLKAFRTISLLPGLILCSVRKRFNSMF